MVRYEKTCCFDDRLAIVYTTASREELGLTKLIEIGMNAYKIDLWVSAWVSYLVLTIYEPAWCDNSRLDQSRGDRCGPRLGDGHNSWQQDNLDVQAYARLPLVGYTTQGIAEAKSKERLLEAGDASMVNWRCAARREPRHHNRTFQSSDLSSESIHSL